MKRRAIIQLGFSMIGFLGAIWSLLWVYSSASLNCIACDCRYRLLHDNVRCREPVIAEILCLILGSVAVTFLCLGIHALREVKQERDATP